jgi:hypothetical protein
LFIPCTDYDFVKLPDFLDLFFELLSIFFDDFKCDDNDGEIGFDCLFLVYLLYCFESTICKGKFIFI